MPRLSACYFGDLPHQLGSRLTAHAIGSAGRQPTQQQPDAAASRPSRVPAFNSASSAGRGGADPARHPRARPTAQTLRHTDTPPSAGSHSTQAPWRRRSGGRGGGGHGQTLQGQRGQSFNHAQEWSLPLNLSFEGVGTESIYPSLSF